MRKFVENLKRQRFYAPQVVYHHLLPPEKSRWTELELPGDLARALEKLGIGSLYAHQAAAIEMVRRGKNVVIATPTASGKTLTYNLPVMESLLQAPDSKALYIFPLKALEQDQLKAVRELASPSRTQSNFRPRFTTETPPATGGKRSANPFPQF